MISLHQLPCELANAFEQLLLHRDFGPSGLFSQTAESWAALNRPSGDERSSETRLSGSRPLTRGGGALQKAPNARTEDELGRYEVLLDTFRQEQFAQERTVSE